MSGTKAPGTHNLWKIDRFSSKLVSFLIFVTNRIARTKTLAYYGIFTL
jgi:hypothetical protein